MPLLLAVRFLPAHRHPAPRHDVASQLAMAGVPLRTISAVLGHRDLRMTARYAHLSPDHLRDAMRALDVAPAAGVDGHYLGTGPETANAG